MVATVGAVRCSQENIIEIERLARFAVDQQNMKENTHLVFGKVLKSEEQVVAGTVYRITLEATAHGSKKVYEAKVLVRPWGDPREQVQEFKLAGNPPSGHRP